MDTLEHDPIDEAIVRAMVAARDAGLTREQFEAAVQAALDNYTTFGS